MANSDRPSAPIRDQTPADGYSRPGLLYIDDSPTALRTIRRAMHAYGLLLETFTSVQAMRERPPGPIIAVLLDVDLGGGHNGLDVARDLRDERADLPIAFITADMAEDRLDALRAIGPVFPKNADVAPAVEWLVAQSQRTEIPLSESG